MSNGDNVNEEKGFVEFRRKVRSTEVLSAAMGRRLLSLQFTGRVCVVVQNRRVLRFAARDIGREHSCRNHRGCHGVRGVEHEKEGKGKSKGKGKEQSGGEKSTVNVNDNDNHDDDNILVIDVVIIIVTQRQTAGRPV
jgi:hypothetical protein